MIEVAVPAVVAIVAAGATLTNKIHNRISDVDRRLDTFELRVAQDYVAKTDLAEITDRIEQHMIRIETKLDRIIIK
jgi:hypothetical protein